ncbi:hypothetical protein MtrunA17_Chr1g0185831 [Medicago truncatula]|uniref:Uncharacterized protein n=1 Tax=Medicago truncatula TaxID=3880 RepID=A0A396JV65_MEDTR|nr:hypothetical protein MtrunA17_Chr1g0185831 [Medicago truncatula]
MPVIHLPIVIKKKCREQEEIEYFLICYVYMGRLSNAWMVPTININGLTNSQMEKEFGIKKKNQFIIIVVESIS